MISATEWKVKTAAAGHRRSPQLKDVDEKLKAYSITGSSQALAALCTSIEAWVESKSTGGSGGTKALYDGIRNRSGTVQSLFTDLRQSASKPAYWPDRLQGDTYVVTLNENELQLMQEMRFQATKKSILMISYMEVNWVKFGFDQLGAMSGLAVDLGHTNYGSDWASAVSNKTSLGQQECMTASKIFHMVFESVLEESNKDPRIEAALRSVDLSISIVLGVVKYYLFKEGVMAKVVPLLGPLKEAVTAMGEGSVAIRLGHKSLQRVAAAKSMIDRNSTASQALDSFESLIKIESTKAAVELAYKVLKDTALVVLKRKIR